MTLQRTLVVSLAALAVFGTSCMTTPVQVQKVDAPAGITRYVRHYDVRMSSSIPEIRLKVLTELTYFHPRDSKLYPPFLRQLLADPSPRIRWEALSRLDDHGIKITEDRLPHSMEVPLVGLLDRTSKDSVAYFRKQAANMGPNGGWAIKALGLIGDDESSHLAESLLKSENVFVRYSAAVALIHFGEIDRGKQVLRQIAKAAAGASGFYKSSAAERLWRLGEKQFIEGIFDVFSIRSSYADGPFDILEDLTGEYFLTEQEWRKWWNEEGKRKYIDTGQPSAPADPDVRGDR